MGMFSGYAREAVIEAVVAEIKRELCENGDKPEVCAALKRVGRFVLGQFEWNIPDWAQEYVELFRE